MNQASSCIPAAMTSSPDVLEDHPFVRRHQSIGGDPSTISYAADGKQLCRPGRRQPKKPFVVQKGEARVSQRGSQRLPGRDPSMRREIIRLLHVGPDAQPEALALELWHSRSDNTAVQTVAATAAAGLGAPRPFKTRT